MAKADCVRRVQSLLASGPECRATLRRAVEAAASCLGTEACHLLLYDETSTSLVLEATWGLEQDAVGDVRLSPTEGVVGLCFRSGEVINIPDMHKHPEYAAFNCVRAREYASLLTVPLKAGEASVGVLALSSRSARRFPEVMVATAMALAVPFATFVTAARQRPQPAAKRNDHRSPITDHRLPIWDSTHNAADKRGVTEPVASGPSAAAGEQLFTGVAVTDGVARGRVCAVVGYEALAALPPACTDDRVAELARFRRALQRSRQEMVSLEREASVLLAAGDAAIFHAHQLLLEDTVLIGRIEGALARGCRLHYALNSVLAEIESAWGAMATSATRDFLTDLRDIFLRLYQAADEDPAGHPDPTAALKFAAVDRPLIVARAMLPSQLMRLPLARLAGVICEEGGLATHTAVLAKALCIPMLVGVKGAMQAVRSNADAILDCLAGFVVLNPSPAAIARYESQRARRRGVVAGERRMAPQLPPCTADGVPVQLSANIALSCELPLLQITGAQGIGLYRTEFMCMTRRAYPDEAEQYRVLRQAVEAAGPAGTTIRLLDVGHDKCPPFMAFPPEANPALGVRGLRYLLANPDYLKPHLRAILRAASHGPVSLLLPMVTDVADVVAARQIIGEVEAQLAHDGLPFRRNCPLGIMLEVPAACLGLPHLLPHIEFVSIGTNDLTQYLFAADRASEHAAPWYHQFHPLLFRIIRDTCVAAAAFPGRTVTVCGELAANPRALPLLLGAGVRRLSMGPTSIAHVRRAMGGLQLPECEALLHEAVEMSGERQVRELLEAFAAEHAAARRVDGEGAAARTVASSRPSTAAPELAFAPPLPVGA